MELLADTHVLLWAAAEPERLDERSRDMILSPEAQVWFSAVSIWEVAIKSGLGRDDFKVSPYILRRALLDHDYRELTVNSTHAAAVSTLPSIHRDPFDRLLLAQAEIEGMLFLTADEQLLEYPGLIHRVG